MITKTVTVQLFSPSHTKSGLLLLTMDRYAKALQYLLERYQPAIEEIRASGVMPTQFELMKLPDKDALASLNVFEMQPFKDSLKLDFAMLISSYLSLCAVRKTSYPLIYTDDEDITEIFSSARPVISKAVAALSKYRSPRTLLFGRYDTGRDFCFLRDELSGNYFVKVYLFPASSDLRRTYTESHRLALKYVARNSLYLETRKQKERYLIFPLACGKKQTDLLDLAAKDPSSFRTARIFCRSSKFYLAVSISQDTPAEQKPMTLLGVARGYDCPLHLSLTVSGTQDQQSFRLTEPLAACDDTARLHIWANKIIRIARDNDSQILYEGLTRRTGLQHTPTPAGKHKEPSFATQGKIASLSILQYKKLCFLLSYKAAEAGLPKPIALSAARLYQTCPACGYCSGSNRFLPGLMICTKCGYSADSNVVGSSNLIHRFESYKRQRVLFTCRSGKNGIFVENPILGTAFPVRPVPRLEKDFYAQLETYLEQTAPRDKPFPYDPSLGRQKYGLLRKLRSGDLDSSVIELIGLPCRKGGLLSQYFLEPKP